MCYAQKKSTIAINIGVSIPAGDFASKNVENPEAGLANTGISIGFSYDYQVVKNFGVSTLVRVENNSFDSQTLSSGYDRTIGSTWTTTADEWTSYNFLIGGYYSFTATPKIRIHIKGMAGAANIKQPPFESTTSYQGNNYSINISEKKTTAFSYLLGAGVKFDITGKLAILAGVDFSAAQPKFKEMAYSTNVGSALPVTGKVRFSTVNMSTGIGYKF